MRYMLDICYDFAVEYLNCNANWSSSQYDMRTFVAFFQQFTICAVSLSGIR